MSKIHKHHIIPKHMGGTDDESNLIELTVEEHQAAHLQLYNEFGDKRDLCAYYMLSGKIEEFRSTYGKLGNEVASRNRKLNGFDNVFDSLNQEQQEKVRSTIRAAGIKYWENITDEQMKDLSNRMKMWTSTLSKEYIQSRGKKGGLATIASGKGSFADPIEHAKAAAAGGKVQGRINAETGHLKRIAQERSRKISSGEIVIIPYITITDGLNNKRMDKADYEKFGAPIGWKRGKYQKPRIKE